MASSYRRAVYRFRELLEEAGIANELVRAGVPLTQGQHLMGHSDPKLTAALYTHLGVEDLRDAIGRLEA